MGVAAKRKAIAKGLKGSFINENEVGMSEKELMSLLLLTQYLDMLTAISVPSNSNTSLQDNQMIISSDPGCVWDLHKQLLAFPSDRNN